MKFGYYVEELLEDYKDNPFYDMIIDMMKTYVELDDKSKKVIRDCAKKFRDNIKKRRRLNSPTLFKIPEKYSYQLLDHIIIVII